MRLSTSSRRIFIRIRFLAVVVGILLWVVTDQIAKVTKYSLPLWSHILRNPTASYDQRMMSKWGTDYRFPAFVRDHTPPSAVIMYPPWVAPWINQGNSLLLAYFLYPRRIYPEGYQKIETNKAITHVMVAWGKGKPTDWRIYGWPKFPVNSRRFFHFPRKREILLAQLSIESLSSDTNPKDLAEDLVPSSHLLENYLSDSEKEVNNHELFQFDRPLEYVSLTYTFNNYDYWTKKVRVVLTDKIFVKARVRANLTHSVNLITEVAYGNGKLAVFESSPNREQGSWEDLSIEDLYERAKRYGVSRGWNTRKMEITKIGINPGLPLEMPYLEKYGVIELERGQKRKNGGFDIGVECAPIFVARGNFYRAKDQIREAIANYQLSALLNPDDAWVHFDLGGMYRKQGRLDKTIEEYQRAIEMEPNIAWFHFALGEVYRKENRADLALSSLKKAAQIDPSGIWLQNALGDLYLERKMYDKAYEHFEAASRYKLSVDRRHAEKALEWLRRRNSPE
jgi:hypothetical protein